MDLLFSALLVIFPLTFDGSMDSPTTVTEENTSQQLYLSVNIEGGKKILLSDNSLYEVNPSDVSTASSWLTPIPISISSSGDAAYPYKLTNQANGASVNARLVPKSS